jgi:protein-tyrosine phosphatase
MDVLHSIQVEPAGDGYRIRWHDCFSDQPVNVHVGPSPTGLERSTPRVDGALGQAHIPDLDPEVRHYFRLEPAAGDGITVAERAVPLAGGINFRDVGGYATGDGRRVDWGRLFRSGHLSKLTGDDKRYFGSLDIRTVCDFRTHEELENENAALPNHPAVEILAVPPGVRDRYFFHRLFASTTDPEAVVAAMHEVMRSLIRDAAAHYARLFEILLAHRGGNILLNCSAGKERTGVGAALVLTALGVPRETIRYDFMLSKAYFPALSELDRVIEKYEVKATGEAASRLVMPLLETRASYIESAFAIIDEEFGSGEAYLQQACGVGAAELRRLRDEFTH